MADRHGTNLSVTGTGKVQVSPDEAIVHFNVITDGRTAAEAVANNARQTQAVLDAVSAQPNHGVTTSGLSVSPILNYEPNTSAGTIVGFRATNGVEVTTKPGYVGQIYDVGIAAGANQTSGITFRIQDEGPHREVALRLAVEEAFKEASIVAGAAGIGLGEVEAIQVEPDNGRVFFRTEAFDAKAQTTPVIPERQTITARVQVQYRTRGQPDVRPGPGQGKSERDVQGAARRPGSA